MDNNFNKYVFNFKNRQLSVYQDVSLFSRKHNLSSLKFMNQTNRNKAFEIGAGIVQVGISLHYLYTMCSKEEVNKF